MFAKLKEKMEARKNRTEEQKIHSRQKIKLIIILSVEIVAIFLVLLLIFFSGKKSYTVHFDLNGGMLISGDLTQRITQGGNATPPEAAKFGHYLRGWSGSYKSITRDVTIKAIWEYETSPGISYYLPKDSNYCEISGSYDDLQGEIFIGAYHSSGSKVLGIQAGVFKNRTGITAMHLLDGILTIDDEAFMGCENMEVIDIPSTVVRIGKNAFKNCKSLTTLVLPASLETIEPGAFEGCTSLTTIVMPERLLTMGKGAFKNCTSLTEVTIPASLKTVPTNAFMGCEALASVTISEGVKTINAGAFSGCELITELFIPKSVRRIGQGAFTAPEMNIGLYVFEDEIPVDFIEGWHPEDATLTYGVEHGEDDGPYVEDEDDDDGLFDDGLKNEEDIFIPVKPGTTIDPDKIFDGVTDEELGDLLFPSIKYPELPFPPVEDETETPDGGETTEGETAEGGDTAIEDETAGDAL